MGAPVRERPTRAMVIVLGPLSVTTRELGRFHLWFLILSRRRHRLRRCPPQRSWWSCWLLVRSQPLLVRRQLVPWRLWHRPSRVSPVEAPEATVGMGVVLAVLRDRPLTRTSSRPTRPCSHRRTIHWRRSTGFACWSRSFACSEWPTSRRCTLRLSSFWGLQVPGGKHSRP